jgi:hypothetical protein
MERSLGALERYWVLRCVDLHSKIEGPQDAPPDLRGPVVGYFQNFGVTAPSEAAAREIAGLQVSDGVISWAESESKLVDGARLHPDVIERAEDWDVEGVWYKSGRAFFPDE